MYKIFLFTIISWGLIFFSLSAQTSATKAPTKKTEKALQDSLKSDSSVTVERPKSRKWVKDVLKQREEDFTFDSDEASSGKDTPYQKMQAQNKEVIPLLMSRPVSGFNISELKSKWILLFCETYMQFRLAGIPGISMVSPDTLASLIISYEDYNRAISVEKYKKVADKLSVPYFLYLQCQYTGIPKEVNFLADMTSLADSKSLVNTAKIFSLKHFCPTLDEFLMQIVEKMGIPPDKQNQPFLATPLMSKRARNLKGFGEFIAQVDELDEISWDNFLKKYNELLRKSRHPLIGYYIASKICEKAEKYEKAAEYAYALINKLGNKYPPAFLTTARYYRLSKNYDEALKVIERGAGIQEIEIPLKREQARCFAAKNDFKQAAELYKDFLQSNENDVDALVLFSQKYNHEQNAKEALSYSARVLAIDPNNKLGLIEKGKSLTILKKYNEALSTLEKVPVRKRDALVFKLMGDIYAIKKEYPKAIDAYHDCLSKASKQSDVLIILGDLQIKVKKNKGAAQTYEKLFNLDNAEYYQYLIKAAMLLEKENDIPGVKRLYDTLYVKDFADASIKIKLASMEFDEKNYKKTITLLSSVKRGDLTNDSKIALGIAHFNTGSDYKAQSFLEEVMETGTPIASAVEMLAKVYDKKGDLANAAEMYEKYLTLSKAKQTQEYALRIAKIYEDLKNKNAAIDRYKKNIEMFPQDGRNYDGLIQLYIESGSYSSARQFAEKASILPKVSPKIWKTYGVICINLKDTSAAISHYKKYLGSVSDADVWIELSDIYFLKGRYKDAVHAMESVIDKVRESDDLRKKLGIAYHANRQYDMALQYLDNVKQAMYNKDIETLKKLVDCYEAMYDEEKLNQVKEMISKLESRSDK